VRKRPDRILVIGYGNPGRGDDGLGPEFAAAVDHLELRHLDVECAFQLTVEHSLDVADHDVVLFVDAASTGPAPFTLCRARPQPSWSVSTHRVEPATVLALAVHIFDAQTEGYLLGIRGYEFGGFKDGLSPRAKANLAEALDFLLPVLQHPPLRKQAGGMPSHHGRAAALTARFQHV
jgi:hydrogenase maturation protease